MKGVENYKVGKIAKGRSESDFKKFLKSRYPKLSDKEVDFLSGKHYPKEEKDGDSSPVQGKAGTPSK